MLFSEATDRPVLTTDTAGTVGKISSFVVDSTIAKVIALRLNKTQGPGDTLHWEDLTAFGTDAVTVASAKAIVAASGRAAELSDKQFAMVGKRLLTDAGNEIGVVTDVEFDPSNGAVVSILTPNGPIHSRLVGCGSYAVIVTDA